MMWVRERARAPPRSSAWPGHPLLLADGCNSMTTDSGRTSPSTTLFHTILCWIIHSQPGQPPPTLLVVVASSACRARTSRASSLNTPRYTSSRFTRCRQYTEAVRRQFKRVRLVHVLQVHAKH